MIVGKVLIEPQLACRAPKLTKACAALNAMHELFDQTGRLKYAGRSLDSCILSALTARDFLRRIGFSDARVEAAYVMIRAWDAAGSDVWSVGVGDHDRVAKHLDLPTPKADYARHGPTGKGWNGHLVVELPALGAFLDPTVGQCARPAWPSLPDMACVEADAPENVVEVFPGMPSLGTVGWMEEALGHKVICSWLRQPWNKSWKQAPDAVHKGWRKDVVNALAQRFGKWRDAA